MKPAPELTNFLTDRDARIYRIPLNGFPADRHWRSTNTFDWGPVDVPDSEFSDTQKTDWAIGKLEEDHEKPFFLAVGVDRPHQPLFSHLGDRLLQTLTQAVERPLECIAGRLALVFLENFGDSGQHDDRDVLVFLFSPQLFE